MSAIISGYGNKDVPCRGEVIPLWVVCAALGHMREELAADTRLSVTEVAAHAAARYNIQFPDEMFVLFGSLREVPLVIPRTHAEEIDMITGCIARAVLCNSVLAKEGRR